jgi:DNA excision repair protein ERCC-2
MSGDPSSLQVSVTTLCAFAARAGDLDRRFTPAPSALDGLRGHQAISARRGNGHVSEVSLSGRFGDLTVRGRADGYDPSLALVEEIKTHRGQVDRIPANQTAVHWAQAKVYGHLLCERDALDAIDVRLLYFDPYSDRESPSTNRFGAGSLTQEFDALCARCVAWGTQEADHRQALLLALKDLTFPHPRRAGHRDLARQVFQAVRRKKLLLAQAPTGIGKTLGTLFPMLKAMAEDRLDKLFFLTVKTTGRGLALDALDQLKGSGPSLPVRVIELVAREKACVNPGAACHGDACSRAKGFYDRLPAARQEAVHLAEQVVMRGPEVAAIAEAHAICPYYLSQELVRWADVVVADVNHWFDSSALLYSLAQSEDWRIGLLVDEAHNLVDRARGMYSASLTSQDLNGLRGQVPASLKAAVSRLRKTWNALLENKPAGFTEIDPDDALSGALDNFIARTTDYLADHADQASPVVMELYFAALQWSRLVETFGDHSLCTLTKMEGERTGRLPGGALAIRNVVPASFVAPRLEAAEAVVLFSATLQPQPYYADLLGLPEDHVWLDVPSPFRPEQLDVRMVNLSTRWDDRSRSVEPIAQLIVRQYDERPGNYLAFFSSFHYLGQVAERVQALRPDVPAWVQESGMAESKRQWFIDQFQPQGRGVGFAVLGGAFAEGVDLPGSRLIGAFVATLGLPPVGPVQEATRRRIEALWRGRGYDYACLVPGVRKVVQAAGRVIRGEGDEGVLYLIDDRFAAVRAKGLLPRWWATHA